MESSVSDQLLGDAKFGEHMLLKQCSHLLGCDGLMTGYEMDHLHETIATDKVAVISFQFGQSHYEIGGNDLPGSFRHSIWLQGCLDHGSILDPATDVTCADIIPHKLAHSRPPVVS